MSQILSWLTNFKKECPVCNSTGTIVCNCNENNELSCPNCHGTGVVSVRKTTSQTYEVPCNYPGCKKGKVSCGVCSGTGKNAYGTPCSTCKGKGTVDCHVCKGVGKIKRVKQESWLEHEPCHICNGRGLVECYQCHGTKVRVCPECKGSGTVRNTKKIALLAVVALLVIAMPVLAALFALIGLGYCLFSIEQKNKEKTQTHTEQTAHATQRNREDAKIEFGDVE